VSRIGAVVIGLAIIWTAVILGSSMILEGTGYFAELLPILGGGAAASVIVVGGGLRRGRSE
jgi:hypothetical protein